MKEPSTKLNSNAIPSEVKFVLSHFCKIKKDSVRLVGGCVRDILMNKAVSDYDFATQFKPEETKEILLSCNIRIVEDGIKFGTIRAIINSKSFEITTLRKESNPTGRHFDPEFIDDYKVDASRRDFTINALYADENLAVHDYFGGISDLKNNIVRFIGDPSMRITEDYLRILRFFRFSCYYSKNFDASGLNACKKLSSGLSILSKERIRYEIAKIFECDNIQTLSKTLLLMEEAMINQNLFSFPLELNCLIQDKKLNHKWITRFASVLGKNKESQIREKISLSKAESKLLSFLLDYKDKITSQKQIKKLLISNTKSAVYDLYMILCNLNILQISDSLIQTIENFEISKFPLSSNDVISAGFIKNQISEKLNEAKIFWAENDFLPKKEELMNIINNGNA